MQGVILELAQRDNALALQPVQFDRHSERNSGRLLSIIASPQPSQTASNGSRSPNCGHPAVFAPPTLYERFCQPARQLLVIVGRDGYARALCEGMTGDALPRMPIDSRQGTT